MPKLVNITGVLYSGRTGQRITDGRLYMTPRSFIRLGRDIITPSKQQYDVPISGNLSFSLCPSVDGVLYDVEFDPDPSDTNTPFRIKDGYFADVWNVPLDYSAYVTIDPDVLAYWRLADTSGTTATDTSGHNHPGTYSGGYTLNQTSGITDSLGVLFNGTTGKVAVASYDPFSTLTAVTIEGWVKGDGTAWAAGNETVASSGSAHYLSVNNGKAYGALTISGTLRTTQSATAAAVDTTRFYHVALTWSSGDYLRLYLNGVQVDTSAAAYSGTLGSAAGFGLAALSAAGSPSAFFGGTLDDIAIYSRALTATELVSHYNYRVIGNINIATL